MKTTKLNSTQPGGLFIKTGTRLLCSDGIVRGVQSIAQTADTFFSVPCSVRVKGKTVSGYATNLQEVWITREKETDFKHAMVFITHQYGKNYKLLPDWPSPTGDYDECRKLNKLIQGAPAL